MSAGMRFGHPMSQMPEWEIKKTVDVVIGVANAAMDTANDGKEPTWQDRAKIVAGVANKMVLELKECRGCGLLPHAGPCMKSLQKKITYDESKLDGKDEPPKRFIDEACVRMHHQAPDSKCLYHSLMRGVGKQDDDGTQLRNKVVSWEKAHLGDNCKLDGFPVREMLLSEVKKHDGANTTEQYLSRLLTGHLWGGAIEVKVFVHLYRRTVVAWVREGKGFREHHRYKYKGQLGRKNQVNVLWNGANHYDALEVHDYGANYGKKASGTKIKAPAKSKKSKKSKMSKRKCKKSSAVKKKAKAKKPKARKVGAKK